ncbi:VCBS repeat-containing protein [Seonamhaeicola maritimus]|uniref:VCBS repeat-containing protein n=1 Tax=Seonamhaeicola maritimus TaxID=2591822 RepID=UPI0024940091|nr:VCBS repeat-containing protein [Seonamhaeicola maritimus]
MKKLILLLSITFLIVSCKKETETKITSKTSFKSLTKEDSGISFSNDIIENDTLNYFTFPYMYMGGGVAIGDINNDGLSDIYFTGNMTDNKLYVNKGNMQFDDISKSAGVTGDDRWYTGVTMADVNADGWLDIYVSVSGLYGETKNQLFINNQDATFTEQAENYGLADASYSIQSTFFDYNNDGLLDVFVANYPLVLVSQGNKYYYDKMQENKFEDSGHLFKNNGDNTFTDVTTESGVQNFGMTLGLLASDFNNDGWQDLYLSNDFNVPDYFYLNNGDGTFKEIVKDATNHTSMFGMGIDVADFNNDKLLDFVQLDMTPEDYKRSKTNMASMSPETFYEAVDLGMHYQYMQNTLQVNNGVNANGIPIFSNISRLAGMATTDWSWGVLFADFDNDGLKDVIVTNGMKRDVNNNDVNKRTKIEGFSALNKGIDYREYPSTPIDNYVYKNEGNYMFSKANEKWGLIYEGFSNGVSYADFDNDGDLDLVINNLGDIASVFENETNDESPKNYLKVKFKGPKNNYFGLGTRVTLKTNKGEQFQELTLSRGFQSSVEPKLYFGLGDSNIKALEVVWPNGNVQSINNVAVNQELEIRFEDSNRKESSIEEKSKLFKDITEESGISFKHEEDKFDDFLTEPLLPHKNSAFGPALTVGDINGDGLEDFFVGNATGSSASMYVQNENGSFSVMSGPWEADGIFEDTGALLFDADNDGDNDLYVVNGGNDATKPESFYQDRLYINTKNGFEKTDSSMPKITSSGNTVVTADFDNDDDLDLFVGGRIVPGKYPFPAKSYILRNDGGKEEALKFTNVTEEVLPELNDAGLVTSALWDDFNEDGKTDLIITGEWMPIRFFENKGNRFEEVTKNIGLNKSTGWWYGLEKGDVDGDGDTDYLAGNLGLNYKYKAKKDKPFEVYANDFDENGTMDIVLSYEKNGKQLPLRGRECSSQQVPAIAVRFETFELFADASLADIYGQAMLDQSLHYEASVFENSWIENQGNGKYKLHKIPNEAQFTSVNTFQKIDLKESGFCIIAAGNLYNAEVETPRNDAGVGSVIKFNDKGEFSLLPTSITGLFIKGEIRNLQTIRLGKEGQQGVLFARNDDTLKLMQINIE